ncbi:hypothetical protein V7S43_013338 [Phytophthora oleae]|uniref:F-box domain-containing protein n=1 Tax=Phytophthora oleae TaxID=2107226 RepID=A0ABD3F436_9STRA
MADGGVSRRSSRHGPQHSNPPSRSSTISTKSKASKSRNRQRSSPRIRSAIKAQSPATTLPADLWTRLLQFLTWRDTTAMLNVCSEWRNVLNSAKKLHPEWKATVLGPSSNGSESLELLRTNHLNWADTRFPPDLVLLSVASKDPSPWHSGGYWEEAIAAMEEAKLLPRTCRIVGIFTMNEVLGTSEEKEGEMDSSAVTLSISVAHLPETTVEMAEFDRKDLRRCQRGVELDNPFTELEKHESPSFLLFGVNDQSASQLIPVVEGWYPQSTVVGGVSPLIDRCVPLATYLGAPVHQKRKNRTGKRRSRPRGRVSFPSTMLLRFHGNIGIKSFSSSGYYPITPVIRCEVANEAEELAQVVTYDLVSTSPNASEEVPLHRIMDLLEPSERFAIEQEGRTLNIFSCSDSAPLDRLLSKSDVIPTAQIDRLEFIFWLQGGLMMLPSLSWLEGAYGILASHQPTRTSQALTEALQSTKEALSSLNERGFGAFIVAGALNDVEDLAHAMEVSQLCTEALNFNLGGCLVSSSIGPVAFPGDFRPLRTMTQVQIHTTCGAIFFTKA